MPTKDVQLVAALAVGISRMLQSSLAYEKDEQGFYYHGFSGPFDEACYVLWELDVAHAASEDGGPAVRWPERDHASGAATFCFLSASETRVCIASQVLYEQDLVDRVITIYLKLACEYGHADELLSTSREPFNARADFALEISALVESGYLERSSALVQWTEKISALMKALEFWDSYGVVPMPRIIHLSDDSERKISAYLSDKNLLSAINIIRHDADATISEAIRYIEQIKRS